MDYQEKYAEKFLDTGGNREQGIGNREQETGNKLEIIFLRNAI
jgi:hypothetical protein